MAAVLPCVEHEFSSMMPARSSGAICPGISGGTEKAAKGDGSAGVGGSDEDSISVMAVGVFIWREQVLTFFPNGTSSSSNLRLLPGMEFCGDITGTDLIKSF